MPNEENIEVLGVAKSAVPGLVTKSSIMVGLGETDEEVRQTMRDLRVYPPTFQHPDSPGSSQSEYSWGVAMTNFSLDPFGHPLSRPRLATS